MSLPYMNNKSIMRPTVRTQFGGLNNNLSARDGEIVWMENMSSQEFPLLTPRNRRVKVKEIWDPQAFGAREKLFWVERYQETGAMFMYDGHAKSPVSNLLSYGKKQFACMNNMILIFPDKKYYDIEANTYGDMEKTTTSPTANPLYFENGEYAGVPAAANTLRRQYSPFPFSPGDAVTISGCTKFPENNKTLIVREVETIGVNNYLRFYENSFTMFPVIRYTAGPDGLPAGNYRFHNYDSPEGTYQHFTLSTALSEGDTLTCSYTRSSSDSHIDATIGGEDSQINTYSSTGTSATLLTFEDVPGTSCDYYLEAGPITITRKMPDLDYVCVNENRLWGCTGDTIYASALGDPFNFYVFDGLSTDSWQSAVSDEGDFTACVSYGGYPIFFKENSICKVQGDKPSNFQWTINSRFGVKDGSSYSLAVAGETLFYLSRAGICAYNGGAPRVVSEALGANTKWKDAVAGSDGIRYYVSMLNDAGEVHLFVYDTRYGVWHRQDDSRPVGFAFCEEALYMLTESSSSETSGTLYRLEEDTDYGTLEDPITWQVVFADSDNFYETTDTASQNKKGGPLRILIRATLPKNSTIEVKIKYDDGTTHTVGTLEGSSSAKKKTYILPLILRRCDHYRLSLDGYGEAVVYSIAVERYSGSQFQGSSRVSLPNQDY